MKSISLFSAHFSEVWPILFGCIRNWHSPSQYFQRGRFRTCHQHLWCHSAAFSIYRTISDHFGTCWWCSDCSWPCYCSPCRPIAPSAGQQLQSPLRFSSLSWSRQKWTLYSECLAASASPGWFRSWPRPLLSGSFSHGGQNLLLACWCSRSLSGSVLRCQTWCRCSTGRKESCTSSVIVTVASAVATGLERKHAKIHLAFEAQLLLFVASRSSYN